MWSFWKEITSRKDRCWREVSLTYQHLKKYNTSCSSHSTSQQEWGDFLASPTAFCFIWMDTFSPSTLLGEHSPFSCGQPKRLSYQTQPSLHITQLTRQWPQSGRLQRSRQSCARLPVPPNHVSIPQSQWISFFCGFHQTTEAWLMMTLP